jgi:hypothetical protein
MLFLDEAGEVVRVLAILVLIGLALVLVLYPLNQVLPTGFHGFIPQFLFDRSVFAWVGSHSDFIIPAFMVACCLTATLVVYRRL